MEDSGGESGETVIQLPTTTLFSNEILQYVELLQIPHFTGVWMRDELPISPLVPGDECGILNLNTHYQPGSHWTCWHCDGGERYYFDSFGEPPPLELLRYLKTPTEYRLDIPAIRISAVTVQHDGSSECGALCLYVLRKLSERVPFPELLDVLETRYQLKKTPLLTLPVDLPDPLDA